VDYASIPKHRPHFDPRGAAHRHRRPENGRSNEQRRCLERAGSQATPATIWPLSEPVQFEPWKRLDAPLHAERKDHLFELLSIRQPGRQRSCCAGSRRCAASRRSTITSTKYG
jgi:hypothetical protein